ncbi:MAG: hypothetical protein ACRD4B_10625, partial [Acidobacteriota bacterium]
ECSSWKESQVGGLIGDPIGPAGRVGNGVDETASEVLGSVDSTCLRSGSLACPKCHTQMKIVSVIKDGALIDKILAHLCFRNGRRASHTFSCCGSSE